MSQFDFGTIDPYVVDGVQLADMLNNWRNAIHSWHRGGVRPSYVVPGMMWINDAGGAANWVVNVYLSPTVGDVAVFNYNTTTGAITVAAAAGGTFAAATLLAQAAASPSVQWNASGNPIDAKAWRATVNAAGALVLSSYTDAGVVIASITFNRDGSIGTGQPAMRLYAETVLAAAAVEMRANVPAGAKAIELWFATSNVGNVNDALAVNGLNGATINAGANHNAQFLSGSGAVASASFAGPVTGWQIGSVMASVVGVIRPQIMTFGTPQTIGKADCWSEAAAGTRYNYSVAFDGGGAVVTGFRLANISGTNFVAGSYLRAFAAY
jgi:hypothetical protein